MMRGKRTASGRQVATLKTDDFAEAVQYWYVRSGPLDGKFLIRSVGGWGVRTPSSACKGRGELTPILNQLCATL